MSSAVVPFTSGELAARLDAWAADAAGAFAPNTERAWRADWAHFSAWCSGADLPVLPADPGTIAAYLRAEAAVGRAVATIRRRAATIARAHRAAGLPSPCGEEPVRLALRAIARERGTDQRQAPGLVVRDADRIVAHLEASTGGPTLKDRRDLALMLVGRDLLARSSELVSLTVEMITWQDDGTAHVTLRRIKTSTGSQVQYVGPEAAGALRGWLQASGIATGPVFRGLTKGHRLTDFPLCTSDVRRIIKALGKRAKLRPKYSAHSLRVGMAQDLAASSAGLPEIMREGGWISPGTVSRYIRHVDAAKGAVARFHARRARS